MEKKEILMIAFGALVACASAEVKLGTPFADGMVLQRDKAVNVWGTAEAGESVTVSFGGATIGVTAGEDGTWRVQLPPMAASAEGRTLVATGETTGQKVSSHKIADVLVGEVWYCCGQSNTEMPLVGPNPHFSDREGRLVAQMTRKPLIRYAYASNYKWSATPKKTAGYAVAWKTFTPENLGAEPSFSAMGVYFALELHNALGVPVGLVGSYWGGTGVDPWTPACGYDGKASLADVAEREVLDAAAWKAVKDHPRPVDRIHQQPSVLWNEMVAPWCPMTMRGFLWYQGCHNADEPQRYCDKMHALYDGWAKAFENPDLKLYFVQLAPFSRSWYGIQLAQAKFAAEEKNAALVTTADIGNFEDIHPNEKGTVGRRLAALALKYDFGWTDLVADAPVLKDICAEEGRLALRFDHADGWYVYHPAWGVESGFEIAGADGVWKKAYIVNANNGATKRQPWKTKGIVEGRDLILAADGVEKPLKVRYLFSKPWVGTLHATSGLPLGPFEAEVK